MTGNQIRQQFLDYFKNHGHQVVRSSSLVPRDDPTLLFTNAGMVQFKRVFIGEDKRDYSRAVTSQKCVRAGGKHNDLENVGYTARHHTFFEMLGNFSFGDYFKEKAIEHAWDLLINGYGLPKDQLWVSVYLDDDEAYDIWNRKIGLPAERIVRLGEKDNFWSMGDTGPCGPCSEILIDRGEKFGCHRPECKVGCECDRYLEIWNLVFMQFNRDDQGVLKPLPRPSIDTGMGLERIAAVCQNVSTNYETDLLFPIIEKVAMLSEKAYGSSVETDIAMKVIADHSRSAAFLIGDGVLPSNEGKGYVLRRIMRRAIRYGRNLDLSGFLHQTASVVFDIMKAPYPELWENRSFILNVIENEEKRFSETLDNGLKLLNDSISDLKSQGQTSIPGDIIFKLYDTFGFPTDIIRDVLRDGSMTLDMDGFNAAMGRQREQSRSTTAFSGAHDAFKALSAKGIRTEFMGYQALSCNGKILAMVKDGAEVSQVFPGEEIEMVTDTTPFYGESGGQTGDRGVISGKDGQISVKDTGKDPTGLIIHKCLVVFGTFETGDVVNLSVDRTNREAIARNHTATHILHSVLREILGDHVKQSGSMVSPERLRFDFTHFAQVDSGTLNRIEFLVNQRIRENADVAIEEMAAEKAFKSGATALFEEKYGDHVRVISLADFSKELCGGTHCSRTGDIGLFKILGESSVAAGIRRIEALTGEAAIQQVQQMSGIVAEISAKLREKTDNLVERIEKLAADLKKSEKQVEKLQTAMAAKSTGQGLDEIEEINGTKVIIRKVTVDKPAMLRELADRFKDQLKSGVVVLGSVSDSKALLIAAVTKDLLSQYHAGNIIKEIASLVGGGGGGRPDMAQAGGSQPENLEKALERAKEIIQKQ
ncbi:MAG: alanine--tRNA ligase [Proteobacteria bacterium]|nr:alanine--tRNA ligase [Pseudomonadota bacterium]MBU4469879.1 alanine--tRNA ligase [Pseudomonadota bacterium]MCG2751565.1 alanine--tRNA ligase [Desulfobacteraceae bacterium]